MAELYFSTNYQSEFKILLNVTWINSNVHLTVIWNKHQMSPESRTVFLGAVTGRGELGTLRDGEISHLYKICGFMFVCLCVRPIFIITTTKTCSRVPRFTLCFPEGENLFVILYLYEYNGITNN